MKRIFLLIMFSLISLSFIGYEEMNIPVVDSKQMNINSINTWYRTNGSFNRDPSTGNASFEWPKGSGKFARYASGLWLGCISGNDTLTSVAGFSYDYTSGYVDNEGEVQTDSTYRIYSIDKNSFSSYDYINWPFSQGAYKTNDGKPYLSGDQTMFYVYTDAFGHFSGQTSLIPLKAQILQTNWAYNPMNFHTEYPAHPLQNTILMEYRIINRSDHTWNKFRIGIWTEDYLETTGAMKVGCDTNLNFGYTYSAQTFNPSFGIPPAVGFLILKGADEYTGDISDSIVYHQPFGSKNKSTKRGYRDSKLTVYNRYYNSSPQPSDPLNSREVYRVLSGKWRLGNSWINPTSGDTTTFVYPGSPEFGTGWTDPGTGRSLSLNGIGPATLNSGDTMTIVVAQIIARGSSNLNSLAQLRKTAGYVQNFYDNNMESPSIISPPSVTSGSDGKGKIHLSWNDSAERKSYVDKLSGGEHKFQGYNIYQINTFSTRPSEADTVLLMTYDIIDSVQNIYDSTYIPGYDGLLYGIVQKGSNSGITRSITLERDTISRKNFINGTEYKFAVTAYYYNPLGGLFTLPKVRQSSKGNIIRVTPQGLSSGTTLTYNVGDTIKTDQKVLSVMPVVQDPLKLITAGYTTLITGTNAAPLWTLTRNYNGTVTTLFENQNDFSGTQDTAKTADGLLLINSNRKDSGIVYDPDDPVYSIYFPRWSFSKSWEYYPEGKEWFTAPDTTAIKTARIITNRQFQSRSLGMSFPTTGTFRNNVTRVKANGSYFTPVNPGKPILTGGPLRKIKIIFGKESKAYRYVPTDSILNNTPYSDMVTIPFSVFAADELDSSQGNLRQLNAGFMDKDNDGQWNPDTSKLGNYHFTYIFASTYDPNPNIDYTGKNPGASSPTSGFPALDVMYAWLPRVKTVSGISQHWSEGDTLTVSPFRLTKPEYVPGYNLKFNWSVTGSSINKQFATEVIKNIKVFPNPYYGFSELEYNDAQEKFIYISHLPMKATIYIYSLDGVPVKKINRDTNDPTSSLEKWDLKNNDGSYVASGMYIVYVDCGEFGVKTLKIAVFQR